MECTADKSAAACPCTYSACLKRGKCCQCIQYHNSHEELPACFFPPEVERTYDRSRAAFMKAYEKKAG